MRQEAERKQAALEDELSRREAQQKERKNAVRYHKFRFFERQKLMRRIGRLKKQLDADDKDLGEERKAMEAELYENRVLLNYVLVSTLPSRLSVAMRDCSSLLSYYSIILCRKSTSPCSLTKALLRWTMRMRKRKMKARFRGDACVKSRRR